MGRQTELEHSRNLLEELGRGRRVDRMHAVDGGRLIETTPGRKIERRIARLPSEAFVKALFPARLLST